MRKVVWRLSAGKFDSAAAAAAAAAGIPVAGIAVRNLGMVVVRSFGRCTDHNSDTAGNFRTLVAGRSIALHTGYIAVLGCILRMVGIDLMVENFVLLAESCSHLAGTSWPEGCSSSFAVVSGGLGVHLERLDHPPTNLALPSWRGSRVAKDEAEREQ